MNTQEKKKECVRVVVLEEEIGAFVYEKGIELFKAGIGLTLSLEQSELGNKAETNI